METAKHAALRRLQVIPGVGPSIAEDLYRLGIKKVSCLKGKDPEKLYRTFCAMEGCPVDRCLLYVFREAVYYASHERHDPEKLKWWNWKDPLDAKWKMKIAN
jgi:hypothetical protein